MKCACNFADKNHRISIYLEQVCDQRIINIMWMLCFPHSHQQHNTSLSRSKGGSSKHLAVTLRLSGVRRRRTDLLPLVYIRSLMVVIRIRAIIHSPSPGYLSGRKANLHPGTLRQSLRRWTQQAGLTAWPRYHLIWITSNNMEEKHIPFIRSGVHQDAWAEFESV